MSRSEEDAQLLRCFARDRDQGAFAELVRRHIGLVHAAARRQVRDQHLVDDVTQAVFILLARKAGSIGGNGTMLAGWLVNTARLCAMSAARREARHHARERRWAIDRTEQAGEVSAVEQVELTAKLDEALTSLTLADRTAITLRYLQGKPLREVAAAMRISEPAATKRVSRATERMRLYFARHGIELAPAALADVMIRQAMLPAPPQLAAAIGSTASASTSATGGAAWVIAQGARAAKRWSYLAAGAAGLAALLISSVLVVLATQQRAPAQSHAASTAAPLASAPVAKIRIGYYLSDASATTKNPVADGPLGYSMVLYDQMKDPAFDIVPVIERDTETRGGLPLVLQTYFQGKQPVIADDASALKTLDVLVAGSIVTPGEVVDAIEEATRSGMGLMTRNWFCLRQPGHSEQVLRLYGLEQGSYGYEMNALECEVVDPQHPILGSRKAPATGPAMMRANGTFGVLAPHSKGLIRIKDLTQIANVPNPIPDGYAFYTVYTTALGDGRIVCCCYATTDTLRNVNSSVGPQFLKRSLKWLAKRPVE